MTEGRFLFAIDSCYIIQGRGTVVVGEIQNGTVKVGDALDLVRSGHIFRTKCLGVERGHGRKPDGEHFHFIGLLLEGVPKFDVASGDSVTSVGDN